MQKPKLFEKPKTLEAAGAGALVLGLYLGAAAMQHADVARADVAHAQKYEQEMFVNEGSDPNLYDALDHNAKWDRKESVRERKSAEGEYTIAALAIAVGLGSLGRQAALDSSARQNNGKEGEPLPGTEAVNLRDLPNYPPSVPPVAKVS